MNSARANEIKAAFEATMAGSRQKEKRMTIIKSIRKHANGVSIYPKLSIGDTVLSEGGAALYTVSSLEPVPGYPETLMGVFCVDRGTECRQVDPERGPVFSAFERISWLGLSETM